MFTLIFWGMILFLTDIFEMGWFNHHKGVADELCLIGAKCQNPSGILVFYEINSNM